MKKLLTVLLTVLMVCGLVACSSSKTETESGPVETETNTGDEDNTTTETPTAKMTYVDFASAEVGDEVEVLMYVQGHQSWWDNKMTIYGADAEGAYFVYEAEVTEEQAAQIEEGTLIKVTGYKAEWSGEIEIMGDTELGTHPTVEVYPDAQKEVFEATDVTNVIGDTEALASHINQKVTMTGLEVVNVTYKDSESDPDIYIECKSADEVTVNLCVENYLTGPDTEVYQTASELQVGALIDIEGFLYWYEGANPHVTSITSAH